MRNKASITLFELALCAIYGSLLLAGKVILEAFPNIHLVGMFTVLLTFVYRFKALISIYVFVLLSGIIYGFGIWWWPYIYIWAVLWAITMLIPKTISKKWAMIVFPIVCSLHGFLYGTLYAPFQALAFGFNLKQTIAWSIAGIPYDIIHGVSNFALGLLIWPLSQAIIKAHKYIHK